MYKSAVSVSFVRRAACPLSDCPLLEVSLYKIKGDCPLLEVSLYIQSWTMCTKLKGIDIIGLHTYTHKYDILKTDSCPVGNVPCAC